jgi:hypothetical protein
MKIAMFMTWEGFTTDQYDKVRKLVELDKIRPAGAVLHVATADSKGLRITDVWESEKELNDYVQNRLMPKIVEIGISSKPNVEIYPLHNLMIFN